MGADKGNGNAVFVLDQHGVLTGLTSLTFSMPAESLKSDHKTMDKNAYKAMRTDKHSSITFTAVSSTVKPYGNKYQVQSKGKLTISGVTRDVDLIAICNVNQADRSIACSGSYKFKMTNYNVTPPSIMLGAIKTGDDITVKFDLLFKTR
jgi:polyisoprenoid-binding protein YceI